LSFLNLMNLMYIFLSLSLFFFFFWQLHQHLSQRQLPHLEFPRLKRSEHLHHPHHHHEPLLSPELWPLLVRIAQNQSRVGGLLFECSYTRWLKQNNFLSVHRLPEAWYMFQ
jgi:hypothetical protein